MTPLTTATHYRWITFGLVLAVLTLAAACGGDDDTGDSPPTESGSSDTSGNPTAVAPTDDDVDPTDIDAAGGVNSCDLLSKEEVDTALGLPSGDPEPGASGPYETCTWSPVEVALKFVILQVHGGVSLEEFRDSTETSAGFLDEEAVAIENLGDAAFDVGGFIYAHAGDYELLMTNVLGFDLTDPEQEQRARDASVILMGYALDRLPR